MGPFDQPSAWRGLELKYLSYLEHVSPVRTIVEIGVDYGFSLFHLAANFSEAEVTGIDTFGSVALHSDAEQWVLNHIRQFPNARLWKTTSKEASQQWRMRDWPQIDLLHVDAAHDYASVKEYFEDWEPLVRPGGVVMFHDVNSFPNDTGRFFLHLEGRKSLIHEHHGLGFWYKE